MKTTKTDIYNALASAVKFSPACTDKCKQLQTFRVIEQGGGGMLTSANFGATYCDKDKPFFWSRAWHNSGYKEKVIFDFPVLSVIETNYTVAQPLDPNSPRCYDFNITVLDKYSADCEKGKCSGCTGRTINEIYQDTETLLFSALHFLGDLVYAELNDGSTGFYSKKMLDGWLSNGLIAGYEAGYSLGSALLQRTKNATAYKASIPAEGLYGNSITLSVCLSPCEETEYDFNNQSFVELSRQEGCLTCG